MPELEEEIKARKLAKKEKRKAGRKKRLKRWGTVLIVLAIFLVAAIFGIVKVVENYNSKYGDYEELIKALTETVDVSGLTTNKIGSTDYPSFIQKCQDAGVIVSDNGTSSGTVGSELSLSGNEIGAYVNKIMGEGAFELIEVSLYTKDGVDYIKTVSAITISKINKEVGNQTNMPEVMYITTTSELYRFGNKLELRRSSSKINNLSDNANKLIFDELLGESYKEVDGIMNSVIVEKVNDFVKNSSAKLSLVADGDKILLKLSPAE